MIGNRYIGLDFGEKTIGVSVSQGGVAVGVTTIKRTSADAFKPALKELKAIIRQYNVTHIVLGNPLHLSGQESERTQLTLAFKDKLSRYFKSIPVELWDERLSTQAVSRVFQTKPKNYKDKVDEMAAVYILQGFLDKNRKKETVKMENEENTLTLHDDEGNEIALTVLVSREEAGATYALAVDEEDDEVLLLKCIEEDDDMIFEIVDDEHDDFDRVFEMFKADFEEHGIQIEDIDLDA